MERIKKILAAADFSACSQEAIAYAVSLARQLNATILLAHVLEPVEYPIALTVMEWSESDLLKVRGELDRVAEPWRKMGVSIEIDLLRGYPAERIVAEAEKRKCDLIVMGTHGRSGAAHFFMGSVAERVVRSASVPVVTVRRRRAKESVPVPNEEEKGAAVSPEGWGVIL